MDRKILTRATTSRLVIAGLAILLAAITIYLPGISGPFLFDDFTNLLNNEYVKLRTLSGQALYQAAFSMDAGPLRRPVAMLSFALNHYFADGFDNSRSFKATNIAIHAVNALLIFWLVHLILSRISSKSATGQKKRHYQPATYLIAGAVALVWAVHPLHLTSVLYVVQRMTSLSALFTILGLIAYIKGRTGLATGQWKSLLLMLLGLVGGTLLASLSKETGILFPLFILLLEATLFRTEWPWSRWSTLPKYTRYLALGALAFLAASALFFAISYAEKGYSVRSFSMHERILTETRVLWLYLSLIIAPGLNRLAFNHDDIELSTSFISPWTTLPATLGLAFFLIAGLAARKRYPLLSIGILWFFLGHALESTIFSLEIAHEHRNYLPSLGIILVGTCTIQSLSAKLHSWRPWLILPLMAVAFAAVTVIRSNQWADIVTFAMYESEHRPKSPRTAGFLGQALAKHGQFDEAMTAFRRAAALDANESAFLIAMHLIPPAANRMVSPEEKSETIRRLVTGPLSASTVLALQTTNSCLMNRCSFAQTSAETWARALLSAKSAKYDKSFLYYLLGRSLAGQGKTREAIEAYTSSHQLDPNYLHPQIEIVRLLLTESRLAEAEQTLNVLRAVSATHRYPRQAEIHELSFVLEELKKHTNREKGTKNTGFIRQDS